MGFSEAIHYSLPNLKHTFPATFVIFLEQTEFVFFCCKAVVHHKHNLTNYPFCKLLIPNRSYCSRVCRALWAVAAPETTFGEDRGRSCKGHLKFFEQKSIEEQYCSDVWHDVSMLLSCCQQVASMLPACYQHVTRMLRAVDSMLTAHFQHVASLLPV